jgi:hypothetical protein
VGDLQHERLDWSCLVTSDTASESVRERGEQYDVDIRDGKALTLGLFALVVITGTGSLAFPLLVGALLSVVYLGVLPLMVADVYLLIMTSVAFYRSDRPHSGGRYGNCLH